jgi:probable rRNA maturation factor
VTLSLAVQFASRATRVPERAQVRRWALAAHVLAREALSLKSLDSEITIRYVDEKEGRELNNSFRGKNYATNVLTFVSTPSPSGGGRGWGTRGKMVATFPLPNPPPLGEGTHYTADIAICAPVVAREAKAQKKTVHSHHAHMVVHGMLHALGFDHENAVDAAQMEALEIRILRRFRINNPYE